MKAGAAAPTLWRLAPAVLVVLGLPLILWGLGSYSFVNGDEAIYHVMAEHMVTSGDWTRLVAHGEQRFFDTFLNAPANYWMRAALIALAGSNLWTARLWSALFGLAGVVATWALGRRLFGPAAGALAGAIQLTIFQFVYLHGARTGELDTAISFFLTWVAIGMLRAARAEPGGRGLLGHHVALALVLVHKLPLVLPPLAVEAAWLLGVRRARPLLRRWLGLGLLVAPIALAWHLAQLAVHWSEFLDAASAMLGSASGAGGHTHHGLLDNLGFYVRSLAFGAWPWAWLFLPAAVFGVLRARGADREDRLLAAGYALGTLVFFVLLAKRAPWYVMPAYPFLAVFVAGWLVDLARAPAARLELGFLGAALAGAALTVFDWSLNPFAAPAFYLDMSVGLRGLAGLPAVATLAVAFVAVAGAGVWIGARWPREVAVGAVALLLGVALVRVGLPLRHLGYQSPIAILDADLRRAREEGREIPWPVSVPSRNLMLVHCYFAADNEISPAPPGRRQSGLFELRPRGGE